MIRLPKSGLARFALAAVFVLLAGILASIGFWGWLHPQAPTTVSNSETLRNVGFLIGGALAFVFALWRGWEAEHQSSAAQRQSETAQQSLLNERYQTGAEMLGHAALPVRLGGFYALRRLAEDYPEQYHIQIMELLCAFVRFPTTDESIESDLTSVELQEGVRILRPDVQGVMQSIGSRSRRGITLERDIGFRLYLRGAKMSGLQLQDGDLSRAWLTRSSLCGAILPRVDLSGARLVETDLSEAKLWGADLSAASMQGTNLSGADLCGVDARSAAVKVPVQGLTQAQLNVARADPGNPPRLDGVVDAQTGIPLVWLGN